MARIITDDKKHLTTEDLLTMFCDKMAEKPPPNYKDKLPYLERMVTVGMITPVELQEYKDANKPKDD